MTPTTPITDSLFDLSLLQASIERFFLQILAFLPHLLIALIIWFVGSYLIELGTKFVRRFFVQQTQDTKKSHLALISRVVSMVGKVFLVLFILDYLGIGRSFVLALTSSLSNAIAIMLGISFGLALQNDAKAIIEDIKKYFNR
jgi:small-conductance mechanosensitive channel